MEPWRSYQIIFQIQKGDFNDGHELEFSSSFRRQELEVMQGTFFNENSGDLQAVAVTLSHRFP